MRLELFVQLEVESDSRPLEVGRLRQEEFEAKLSTWRSEGRPLAALTRARHFGRVCRHLHATQTCISTFTEESTQKNSTVNSPSVGLDDFSTFSDLPRWSREALKIDTPSTVAVIVNPVAGNQDGEIVIEEVLSLFSEHGVVARALVARYATHERVLALEARETTICVLGGRGTLRETINGVMSRKDRHDINLAILPNGSKQNLSINFGIRDWREGVQRVLSGCVHRMDLQHVEELTTKESMYSALVCGYGLWSEVEQKLDRYKRTFGSNVGMQVTRMHLAATNHSSRARLELDPREVEAEVRERLAMEADFVSIVSCGGQYMHGIRIAPTAQMDNGRLHLLITRAGTRQQLRHSIGSKSGGFGRAAPLMDHLQVSSFTVTPSSYEPGSNRHAGPRIVNVDGDMLSGAPFRVTVCPLALRVFA